MTVKEKQRLELLDTLRGVTLVSMILYHGAWDLVNEGLVYWRWYIGKPGYFWQQSICWTFILLSGFCFSLGRKPLKRGITVFGGGLLVTAVTWLVLPQQRVMLGILTFLGCSMLLLIPLRHLLEKLPPLPGAAGSFMLFTLFRFFRFGTQSYTPQLTAWLPEPVRESITAAWLGLPGMTFRSTDYFPMLPWFFLFLTGWFLYRFLEKRSLCGRLFAKGRIPVLSWMGKHSLLIYLLHQPVLWGVVQLLLLLKK